MSYFDDLRAQSPSLHPLTVLGAIGIHGIGTTLCAYGFTSRPIAMAWIGCLICLIGEWQLIPPGWLRQVRQAAETEEFSENAKLLSEGGSAVSRSVEWIAVVLALGSVATVFACLSFEIRGWFGAAGAIGWFTFECWMALFTLRSRRQDQKA